MKTDIDADLAKQLTGNPFLFVATKEEMLAELLSGYIDGELPSVDAAEVERLLKTSSRASEIYENLLAANRFLDSTEGKAWLQASVPKQADVKVAPDLVSTIGFALRIFFRDHALPVAAAAGSGGREKLKAGEHRFALAVPGGAEPSGEVSLLIHLVKSRKSVTCQFEVVETSAGQVVFPLALEWQRERNGPSMSTEPLVFDQSGQRIRRHLSNVGRDEYWSFQPRPREQ